ncbi:E3 ubiquitin ligase complex SCF subunit scon-2 [Apiospora hydei]|uniref:E3 ubiquitin ligase complex SCF subunit scon-2 n=1 Tax=Apiospora hydei TaxID=1337664 RepID=A0ABR1VUY1_9PEZI
MDGATSLPWINGHDALPSTEYDFSLRPSDPTATANHTSAASVIPSSNGLRSQHPLSPTSSIPSPSTRPVDGHVHGETHQSTTNNCDRRKPHEDGVSRMSNMSQQAVGQTVAPFLREHIPGIYAPVGKPDTPAMALARTKDNKDPNSKFCYRHAPDSKCRKAADENKMALIQSEMEMLPSADQQAIAHVWSLFSAAPTKHRELMLQGIVTQCCFPQLSLVSREVSEQLKIDFLSALPTELSFKILSSLDCVSLCKAAQVSRRWRLLADDDQVWHHMCQQHIDRKCTACGWGLPRLEKRRLRDWKKQQQLLLEQQTQALVVDVTDVDTNSSAAGAASPAKRSAPAHEEDDRAKRQCVHNERSSPERKFRPWKTVYKERFQVGSNWKYGRCSMKVFRGEHTNGVTCLQFDDNILATGSYDSSIKLWDIEKGHVIRTLRGHTSGIRALQFDDRLLVSGSLDNTVRIWNWRTGVCINTLHHQGGVISVHMEGDYLASGSMDQSIKIFNFKTRQTFCLRGHEDYVNHVKLDLASRIVLSASDDTTVKLWDIDSGACIKTYEAHVGQVQQVLPLPDDFEFEDENLADNDGASSTSGRSGSPGMGSSSQNGSCAVDETRMAYGPVFELQKDRPLPPRFMLTGSLDNTLRLWDTATGKCLRTFFGHVEGIWGVCGDSLRCVSGANDATVKVWDPRTGKCERTFTGHQGPVTCVGLSDSRMASGGEDGEVRLYKFDSDPSEAEQLGTPA